MSMMSHDVLPAPAQAIDTHIHLFDPRRAQGVPWPAQDDAILYQPALPARFREVTKGLGIARAIVVECSPWLEDNQWVLDVAAGDRTIAGVVGNLEPGAPDFGRQLEHFQANPLFRGIRYGNLWGRNLAEQAGSSEFISDLETLAGAGLSLDTANPDAALIEAVIRVTDRVPGLRVIIDHLPRLEFPAESQARDELRGNLRELGKRPQVCVKISGVLRRVGDIVPLDSDFYREWLDEIWDIFGDDRLIYGSDWPNSDRWGSYQQGLEVVREYLKTTKAEVAEKLFWKNSIAAYRLQL